ncbi:MAG: nicotinate-nucleotide adenylyltransferase [Candidatus Omnitrophica bacterium]|nr:nicotinate-nucleotide adenylyltransferase [Candidatus Omnitrophota bacterium]
MKIGVLGGTFNPVHNGHLVLAEEVCKKLRLDKMILIPTHLPPHKENASLADAKDRHEMLLIATEGRDLFEVSDIEIKKGGKSYTVETLKELRASYGDSAQIYFIVGSDSLGELPAWKNLDEVLRLAKFTVVNRPGFEMTGVPAETEIVEIPSIDVSSTEIRRLAKEGVPIDNLVPKGVNEYIKEKGLYSKDR